MARTHWSGPIGIGKRAGAPVQGDSIRDVDLRAPGSPVGWTQVYVYARHDTPANLGYKDDGVFSGATYQDVTGALMSGDSQAFRVRAEMGVAGQTGQLRGAYVQAANGAAGGTGGSIMGATIEALGKGFDITTLRGVEIIADNTEGTGTLTDIVGARVRVIGAAATLSGTVVGVEIIDDAATASAAPRAFTSFIRMSKTGSGTATQLIDASTARLTLHDTDQVTLIKFLAADGTTIKTMSYDTSANALVFA